MRILLIVFSLLSFAVGVLGFASMRSDIQIIIGLVGILFGVAFMAMAAIVGRSDQVWNLLKQWEREREEP